MRNLDAPLKAQTNSSKSTVPEASTSTAAMIFTSCRYVTSEGAGGTQGGEVWILELQFP